MTWTSPAGADRGPALRRDARPRAAALGAGPPPHRAALLGAGRDHRRHRRRRRRAHGARGVGACPLHPVGGPPHARAWACAPPSRRCSSGAGGAARAVRARTARRPPSASRSASTPGRRTSSPRRVGMAVSSDKGGRRHAAARALAAARSEAGSGYASARPRLGRRLGEALALGHRRRRVTPRCSARCGRPSSPCSPACGTTCRGRPRRAGCPATATTVTSSGTARPGCTPRCWPPSRRWRRDARVPGRPAGRGPPLRAAGPASPGRASRGRAPSPGAEETPSCCQHRQVRDPRERGHRAGGLAVLAGHGGPRLARAQGLAGGVGHRRLLGEPAPRQPRRHAQHRRRDPARRVPEQVDDSVYTNVARSRLAADRRAGRRPPRRPANPAGPTVADRLRVPFDAARASIPSSRTTRRHGQAGGRTLLAYPWENPQPPGGRPRPTSTTTSPAPIPTARR